MGESFSPVAMCVMDFGDDAVLPMCEFSKFYVEYWDVEMVLGC
ncbi:MAG: hypothetical protein ACO2O5_11295 [Candidatus Caldipriscus sp.]